MKSRTIIVSAILTALFFGSGLQAQESAYKAAGVEISADKVRLKGRTFYSHAVKEHQTLYSIAKAYQVQIIEIVEANPQLELNTKPLRTGDILLIPFKPLDNVIDVPMSELQPSLPVAQEPAEPAADNTADNAEALVDAPEESVQEPGLEEQPALSEEKLVWQSEEGFPSDSLFYYWNEPLASDAVKVSLLLPFDADSSARRNYMNFYFGALLAARDLTLEGHPVDLHVFDTMSSVPVEEHAAVLRESDVIIGPVSNADILSVLPLLNRHQYLVSPLDARSESLCADNRVILAPTPASVQIADAMQWVKDDMLGGTDSLIVVRESNYKPSVTEMLILQELDLDNVERLIEVDYSLSAGLEMNEWFEIHTHLQDTVTRVVAASEHDIFVKDVIRNVYLQNNLKHNNVIYGPAKTRSPEMEEMCDARLHSSVTYHVDYTRPEVIRFVSDFRALFMCEPDNFAFHGYDTMRYFVSAAFTYGRNWARHLPEFKQSGLQIYFSFQKNRKEKGMVNHGLRRLVYSPGFNLDVSDCER